MRPSFQEDQNEKEPFFLDVACGDNFTIAVAQNGEVYSCGSGYFGIHCSERKDDRWELSRINAFTNIILNSHPHTGKRCIS